MARGSTTRMFPVGLYGMLLFALSGLAFPGLYDPVEKLLRTVVCLPLRAYSIILEGQTVHAAARPAPGVEAETLRRVLRREVADAGGLVPEAVPVVLQVRSQLRGRQGGIEELVLDVPSASLRGARPFVTFGRSLLGFLHLDEDGAQPARVRLLAWRPDTGRRRWERQPAGPAPRPARVAAQFRCAEEGAEGLLRFLVEPARAVDDWPLRCALLDDPYLASRLRASGGLVHTARTADLLAPPAGLEIGRLRIWGYPRLDIPVGLFVEPRHPAAMIAAVCVWQPVGGAARASALGMQGRMVPVQLTRYPAPRPALRRWLVTCEAGLELPDRAALVKAGHLLGWLQRPWSGQSLVTPLGSSTEAMNLLLWDGEGRLMPLQARVTGEVRPGATGAAELRLTCRADGSLFAGRLYTGCNGWHGPMGLCLGEAAVLDKEELKLRLPDLGLGDAQVFVGAGEVPR